MHRLPPPGFEVARDAGQVSPIGACDRVAGTFRLIDENGKNLGSCLAVMQRSDERLNDRHGAVMGTNVAPGFEEVSFRNMPMAQGTRLVVIEPEVDAKGKAIDALGEMKIG